MSVYKKLHKIQANRLQVVKNCKANLGGGRVYEYASLDDVLAQAIPAMNAAGLVLTQSVLVSSDNHVVRTEVIDTETGEKVTSDIAMPVVAKWHDFGSGMTYARRYALSALLGIACDGDDDANVAMESQRQEPKKLQFFPIVQKFQADLKREGFEVNVDEAVGVIYDLVSASYKDDTMARTTSERGVWLASILNRVGQAEFNSMIDEAKHGYMDAPGN
jgi:hypothetical protein